VNGAYWRCIERVHGVILNDKSQQIGGCQIVEGEAVREESRDEYGVVVKQPNQMLSQVALASFDHSFVKPKDSVETMLPSDRFEDDETQYLRNGESLSHGRLPPHLPRSEDRRDSPVDRSMTCCGNRWPLPGRFNR